jgi:hypothetical protein
MYIPTNQNNELVYEYDVNSLYPNSMRLMMPVTKNGYITYFEGNITQINPQTFGFFNCIFTSPLKLLHPIIQIRYNTGNGTRTISPLGNFMGMFFSSEIYNALKLGYLFKIKNGYLFDKADIFSDYISILNEIKENSASSGASPNSTWYYIAKLLMNSLYGKLGMSPVFEKIEIIDNDDLNLYNKKFDVDIKYFDDENDKLLISYLDTEDHDNLLMSNFDNNIPNVSVPIASAITAYSRIFMTVVKNRDDIILYYTDTDSA